MSSLRLWHGGIAAPAVAALAVVAVAAAAGKGWPMKQDNAGYLIVETPHYVVKTDLGPDAAQLIATHQETLFGELYARLAGNQAGIIQIPRASVLVVSSKEKYLSLMGSDAKGSQGQFVTDKNQLSAWGPKDDMDGLLETLRHEGTHQLVFPFLGGKCPIWLNEGLSEFFEQAQFTGGRFQVGQAPIHNVNYLKKALEEDRLIPVPKMLAIKPDEWLSLVKNQDKSAYTHYLEAWVMVHFLQEAENGKYRVPFKQYTWHLSRGRDPKEAWEAVFGADVTGFEKRLREYIKDLKPTGGLGCRTNLQFLGFILANIRSDQQPPADMATFRQWALEGRLGEWAFTASSGIKVHTTDRDVLKSLFRCPEDGSKGDATSYELFPGKPGEPPGIRCRCHAGFVLEVTYEKDDDGNLRPRTISKPASSVPPAKGGAGAATSASPPTGAKAP